MKIAAKTYLSTMAAVVGLGLCGAGPLWAQGDAVVSSAAEPAVLTASPSPVPPAAQESTAVKEVLDSIKVPESSKSYAAKTSSTGKAAEAEEEEDDGGSNKIPASVKNVVKRLDEATKDVTIEDLNSAREAVVKLDVLIDIEKRLNDLTTLRQEREEKEGALAAAIPPNALQARPGAMPPPVIAPVEPSPAASITPVVMPETEVEVVKIMGASGKYVATIKDLSGNPKQVKVGDKLPDGSTIQAISQQGVTIEAPNKKRKTIQVKDVYTVFGGR